MISVLKEGPALIAQLARDSNAFLASYCETYFYFFHALDSSQKQNSKRLYYF